MTSFIVHLTSRGAGAGGGGTGGAGTAGAGTGGAGMAGEASFVVEAVGVVCTDHWLMFDAGTDGTADQLVAAVPREQVLYVERRPAPGPVTHLAPEEADLPGS
ncbi:MAG TPA: hypothetical protein VMD59_20655 [Acidimicrobiales bacterium]|nr:hypothetical protein [Acidimicrobiales bacterium]